MHITNISVDRRLNPSDPLHGRYRAYEQPLYRRAYDPRPIDPESIQVTPYDDELYDPPKIQDYLVLEPESNVPTQLGPFSAHLNVIFGSRGSGKTHIANHIHDLLMGQAKVGFQRPLVNNPRKPRFDGFVQLEDGIRRYRLRNDRVAGAVRVEHQLLDGQEFPDQQRWDSPQYLQDWRQIPTPLLEVLLQTTERPSLNDHDPLVMDAIQKLGVHVDSPSIDRDQRLLENEIASLRLQLRNLPLPSNDLLWWERERNRLDELLQRLPNPSSPASWTSHSDPDRRRLEEELQRAQDEFNRLRSLEDDLTRQLATREREWEALRSRQLAVDYSHDPLPYRRQLKDIDDRLQLWRQSQSEVRSHRQGLQQSFDTLRLQQPWSNGSHQEPRNSLEALELQISNARRDLERIIHRTPWDDPITSQPLDRQLPHAFRSMQDGLHEVAQQLHRSETRNLEKSLYNQIEQLDRCERELHHCIDQLTQERNQLLQRIAESYHIPLDRLSLALGDWSLCQENPHLYDWLAPNPAPVATSSSSSHPAWSDIEQLRLDLQRARTRAEDALQHCHHCERELKRLRLQPESPRATTNYLPSPDRRDLELQRSRVEDAIRQWNHRNQLERHLASLELRLRDHRASTLYTHSSFWNEVDRYYRALQGEKIYHRITAPGVLEPHRLLDPVHAPSDSRANHRLDQYTNKPLALLAFRMATADLVANRFGRVPMLVDDGLAGLRGPQLDHALLTLKQFSIHGQQVLIFTDQDEIASRARATQAWVCFLNGEARTDRRFVDVRLTPKPVKENLDINRHLHAVANELEAPAFEYVPHRREPAVETTRVVREKASPYFLHRQDPIAHTPDVEPQVLSRLQLAGLQQVGPFLDANINQLFNRLQPLDVSPEQLEAWQSQARLLCHVPRLRPFDARLLVACGINHPRILASLHPSELMNRVRDFVQTTRGQAILNSGNDFEVARIRNWLDLRLDPHAFTDHSTSHFQPASYDQDSTTSIRKTTVSSNNPRWQFDASANADPNSTSARSPRSSRVPPSHRADRPSRAERLERAERKRNRRLRQTHQPSTPLHHTTSNQSPLHSHDRSNIPRTDLPRGDIPRSDSQRSDAQRSDAQRSDAQRSVVRMTRDANRSTTSASSASDNWRFYLELDSPVVDAPSIGQQMADLLAPLGIHTVADLLHADAASLATQLNHRRTTADTIVAWQHQSRLMCRIPNLRGHDAQLLVAANILSPEEVTATAAHDLLSQVLAIAESKIGQRYLRGSQAPDLAEVNDWRSWAEQSRPLKAA